MFYVEIKPKFFADEIPSFDTIDNIIKKHKKSNQINQVRFYKKYFRTHHRKYIFRKKIAQKHNQGDSKNY